MTTLTITRDEFEALGAAAATDPQRPVCHWCARSYVSRTGPIRVHRGLLVVPGYDRYGKVYPRIAPSDDDCPGSRSWPQPVDDDLAAFIRRTPRVTLSQVRAERAKRAEVES